LEIKGIWQNKYIKKSFEGLRKYSLEEGDTPFQNYLDNIYLKREDLNPTGSWKDRGTAFKFSKLIDDGVSEVVIASSGNAAISLLTFANEFGDLKVNVVVSTNVDKEKLEKLNRLAEGNNHEIILDKNAKKRAVKISLERKAPLLKASTDEDITKGYRSLGSELASFVRHNQNSKIILAASSGATLVGLAEGLMMDLGDETKLPKIIAVQTSSCHPLDESYINESNEKSKADAIVDKSMLRNSQVLKIIDKTNGSVVVINNEELEKAQSFTKEKLGLELSHTSLLPIAAYLKLKGLNDLDNNYICVVSGL